MERSSDDNLENLVAAVILIAAVVIGGGSGVYSGLKSENPSLKPTPHVSYLTPKELSRIGPFYCLPDATDCSTQTRNNIQ